MIIEVGEVESEVYLEWMAVKRPKRYQNIVEPEMKVVEMPALEGIYEVIRVESEYSALF